MTLDPTTWTAIEQIAEAGNSTWQRWCEDTILRIGKTDNITRGVRSAVLEALLQASVLSDRQELVNRPQPALLALNAMFGDADFNEDLSKAKLIDGTSDFVAFEVITGSDQFGRACLWIRNGLRDGTHIAIPLPFTPEQISNALEGK